jgi:hypothetical protein
LTNESRLVKNKHRPDETMMNKADEHIAALSQLEAVAFASNPENLDALLHQIHLLNRTSRWDVDQDDPFWERLGVIETHVISSIKKRRAKKMLLAGCVAVVVCVMLMLLGWNYAYNAHFQNYAARMEAALLHGSTAEVESLLDEKWRFEPGRSGAENAVRIRSLAATWLAMKKSACDSWLTELGRTEDEIENWGSLSPEKRHTLIKDVSTLQSFHEINAKEFNPSDAQKIAALTTKITELKQEWLRETTSSAEVALSALDSCLIQADGVFGEPLVLLLPEMRRVATKVVEAQAPGLEERLTKKMERALSKHQQLEASSMAWVKSFDQMAGEHTTAETHAEILRGMMAKLPEGHRIRSDFAAVLEKGMSAAVLHQQAMQTMGVTAASNKALFPTRPCTDAEMSFLKERLPALEAAAAQPAPDSPDTYRYHLRSLAGWASKRDATSPPQFTQSALFFLDRIYADPWMKPFEKALLCQVVDGVISQDSMSWGMLWCQSASKELSEVLKLAGKSPDPLLGKGVGLSAEKLVLLEAYFTDHRDVDFQQEAAALQLLVAAASSWQKTGVVIEDGKIHYLGNLPEQCVLLAWGRGTAVVGFRSSLGKIKWLGDHPVMGSPVFCHAAHAK